MSSRYVSSLICCYCLTAITVAIPSLPTDSSTGAWKKVPIYYPPAEPNYPAVNPFARSASLPPSDEEAAVADDHSRPHRNQHRQTAHAHASVQPQAQGNFVKHSAGKTAQANVHVSSAAHPANFPASNFRSAKNVRKAEDAFVISTPIESMVIEKPRGVVPKYTEEVKPAFSSPGLAMGPITNPANYFLNGADFQKIETPKCHSLGCEGPYPDDGSIRFEMPHSNGAESCHQTFVELNGCVGSKGYPVGMVCTICCECTKAFVHEFRQSRGFQEGFSRK